MKGLGTAAAAAAPSRKADEGLPVAGIVGFGLLSVAANILMLTGPIFMLQVYDRVIPSRSVPTLVALGILAAALYGFYGLVEWLRSRMANRFGGMVDDDLSPRLLAVLIGRHSRNEPDALRDLDTVRGFLSGPGPSAFCDLPWLPFYLGLIYLLHPVLGLVTFAGAAIITLLVIGNELFSQRPARALTEAQNLRRNLSDDIRSGAEVIRAMSMQEAFTGPWERARSRLADTVTRAADQAAFYLSTTRAFRLLLQSTTLAAGAWLVLQGQSSSGMIIGASILSSRAIAPVEQAVGQWRQFVAARQAWKRLRKQLAVPSGAPRKVELPAPTQRLGVRNLATAPAPDLNPCVSGVSFELKAGDGLGVIGLSGSGKSSLARALVGAWPHLQGEIRLDGQLLSHYPPGVLGAAIGYLPQEVGLFEGSVGENIARFRPGAASAEIIAAAKAAGVHDLIATLPNGYDTNVGERGLALSAGQRQRIGLARALFGDPFLLVLDEPNSNLDAEGDVALTQALAAARSRGAIVVIVAHRPSAISAVDKLLYLKAGRQVAFGEKEDVLRQVTGQNRQSPRLVEVGNAQEAAR